MLPTWISIAIWIIWSVWTLVEIKGPFELHRHNSNPLLVRSRGRAYYSQRAKLVTYAYLILTPFWISYNLWG